ncbi:branched-chain amino acid ABC transporter permease [Microbaculum marinisediminis]|uniref:Branched-chain amino acid ABC transporter permease n=1 Tax=Microbaculum marinisediminis TaxID=2931392 RepID=A0AAW5QZI2_9HYPH|nr:branched-chain amino acid ABC transporter permease [Microbaculum sp. A6E488]MCT8971836.1 branched-chain amino acid ABC transporter permease [Microbaculum sp. A6E488]
MSVAATLSMSRGRLASRTGAAWMIFALLAVTPAVVTLAGDPYLTLTFSRILIFAIAAISLDLVMGYGGLVTLGHAANIGFGAYAVAVLSRHGITDLGLQMLGAIVLAGGFAAVTGAIALRTRAVYFIMITLAFGQMAYFFFVSLSAYGGDDGVALSGRSTIFGSALLESDVVFYYVALALLGLVYLFSLRLVSSRFGRVLTGTREDRLRMQAIGFRPFGYQLLGFAIASCIAAIAGVLLANQTEFVSPAYMSWHRSGELLVMVVLGGMGTLLGGVAGAIVVLLLEEGLSTFSSHWLLGLGVVLLAVVLFSPSGLAGLAQRLVGRGEREGRP